MRSPMARTTYGLMVAGDRPSLDSVSANSASTVPTAMSQAATRPTPPAKAGPCTRAMVGLDIRSSVFSMAASARVSFRFCSKV